MNTPKEIPAKTSIASFEENGIKCLIEIHGTILPVLFPYNDLLNSEKFKEGDRFLCWMNDKGSIIEVADLPENRLSDEEIVEGKRLYQEFLLDVQGDYWEDFQGDSK